MITDVRQVNLKGLRCLNRKNPLLSFRVKKRASVLMWRTLPKSQYLAAPSAPPMYLFAPCCHRIYKIGAVSKPRGGIYLISRRWCTQQTSSVRRSTGSGLQFPPVVSSPPPVPSPPPPPPPYHSLQEKKVLKPSSWTCNFVEVSGHNLESSQTWGFQRQCLHYKPAFQITFAQGRGGLKSVSRLLHRKEVNS